MQAVTSSPGPIKSSFLAVLVIFLVALNGFTSAGPASAHTRLVETSPAAGQKLTAAPAVVSLTFSEGVLKLGAAVKITGPAGATSVGAVKVKNKKASWRLTGDLPNGKYTVTWRVTSQDGHPIDGKFGWVLNAPIEPTGASNPASASNASSLSGPVATSHTPEPQMTGPMPGMPMPGQPATPAQPNSKATTALAIAGLGLLTVLVAGAIAIERRRRPPPGAGLSEHSTG
jgi:methionine-rich copper-binding protein CopC